MKVELIQALQKQFIGAHTHFWGAYPSMEHGVLQVVLRWLGIPPDFVELVRTISTHAVTKLIISVEETQAVNICHGMLQEDPLLCLLFLFLFLLVCLFCFFFLPPCSSLAACLLLLLAFLLAVLCFCPCACVRLRRSVSTSHRGSAGGRAWPLAFGIRDRWSWCLRCRVCLLGGFAAVFVFRASLRFAWGALRCVHFAFLCTLGTFGCS